VLYLRKPLIPHRYKDKAALAAHGSSEGIKNFQKTIKGEDLLEAPLQLKFVKTVGGFSSRI
jgi:quinol monooxygenase YgiN